MSLGRPNGQSQSGQGQATGQAKDREPEIQGPIRKANSKTIQEYEQLARKIGDGVGRPQDEDRDLERNDSDRLLHRQYDPANFIVPGSDAQGHSERIQCRVPPGMLRQISAIVASKKFPFRTDGDVYRWAVWVGIQILDRMEPTPNTFICRIDAANAIIKEQVYLQEYMNTLSELGRMVEAYMASGARGQAVRMIAQVLHQYSKMDDEYWRDRLVREVKEKYGHLMGAVKEVKLDVEEER